MQLCALYKERLYVLLHLEHATRRDRSRRARSTAGAWAGDRVRTRVHAEAVLAVGSRRLHTTAEQEIQP